MSYERAKQDYENLAERCRNNPNDKTAMADKLKAFQQLRGEQRERAKQGTDTEMSKQALQAAYIKRFPEEVRDKIADRVLGKA